uniref:Uncharacterized protein n=1 Tax=Anguilla anguilla TaxID=7936 RepID=A0A0E9RQ29_ANGAN
MSAGFQGVIATSDSLSY